jgi:hypothetical protein
MQPKLLHSPDGVPQANLRISIWFFTSIAHNHFVSFADSCTYLAIISSMLDCFTLDLFLEAIRSDFQRLGLNKKSIYSGCAAQFSFYDVSRVCTIL